MSETRGNNQGRVNLDAALREWPDAERPQKDWEERTQSVLERLRRGERGATVAYVADEELLADPLGQSVEDGHNSAGSGGSLIHPKAKKESGTPMTMTADRERDRRSLQDLAKMASGLTPPPPSVGSLPSGVQRAAEAKKDDSGIVDLAAASQADPGAAARAQSTPLASQGLFDEEPAHSQRPPMSGPVSGPVSGPLSHPAPVSAGPVSGQSLPQQPVPSVPPPPVLTPSAPPVGFAPASMASVHPMPAKKGSGAAIALVVGGLVALSAAAAGGFLYMKSRAPSTASEPVATAPAEPATPAAAPADPTPAPAAEATPTPAAEPSLDPNSLPAVTPPSKVATASKGTTKGQARASKASEPAPKSEGPAKLTEKDLAPTPSGPAGDLGAAMKNVVGDEPAKTPAAATTGASVPTGNVPQKPSQGAVTGAIGAVLPQARACLGPDDPISRASIVFSSAGSVQSVNVSGGAAGKPAEACIKSALTKAKLQPFAEPTYTANITIRHN